MIDTALTTARVDALTVYRRHDVPLDAVLGALNAPGDILKRSPKALTRRVGNWVVKESVGGTLAEALKRSLWRSRYRQGWLAALRLTARGVLVPRPVAFIERSRMGLILGNVLIVEYLQGLRTVEEHAAEMDRRGAAPETIHVFLSALARAVKGLYAADAYHSDISGKNILTLSGDSFYFIDLDGVTLDRPITDARRLKNLVQLYDSFCDLWGIEFLEPFMRELLPEHYPPQPWIDAVRQGQTKRRSRHRGKDEG